MKKNKLIYLLLGFMFAFVACDEPGSEILWDLSFVELDAATTANGTETYTFLRENNGVNKPSGFMLNLASRPLDQAVNVTFEIVAASTDAIENVHYVLNSNTVTIPAGQNVVELPIDIIADGIEAGEQLDIDIRLVSADVEIGSGFGQAVHTIQITCNSDIGGTYTSTTTGTSTDSCCPNETTVTGTVTLTDNGNGFYTISDWSAGMYLEWFDVYGITATTDLTTEIRDICDAIGAGDFNEPFGQAVQLSGSRDAATGVITYTWTSGWGDQATVTLTPQ